MIRRVARRGALALAGVCAAGGWLLAQQAPPQPAAATAAAGVPRRRELRARRRVSHCRRKVGRGAQGDRFRSTRERQAAGRRRVRVRPRRAQPGKRSPRPAHAGGDDGADCRSAESRLRRVPRRLPHQPHRLAQHAAAAGRSAGAGPRAARSLRGDDAAAATAGHRVRPQDHEPGTSARRQLVLGHASAAWSANRKSTRWWIASSTCPSIGDRPHQPSAGRQSDDPLRGSHRVPRIGARSEKDRPPLYERLAALQTRPGRYRRDDGRADQEVRSTAAAHRRCRRRQDDRRRDGHAAEAVMYAGVPASLPAGQRRADARPAVAGQPEQRHVLSGESERHRGLRQGAARAIRRARWGSSRIWIASDSAPTRC